jgi:hypothetical protein
MDTMTRLLLTASAVAVLIASALAPAAGADTASTTATPQLQNAYAYIQHLDASGQNLLRVVFRTSAPLPRRYDGMIRAAGKIDGLGHSLGSAKHGTTCYAAGAEIKNGRTASLNADGHVVRKRAKIGSTFRFDLVLPDGTTQARTVKLRANRPGYDSGRPLGC